GSKAFPESVILGDLLAQLAENTGARVEHGDRTRRLADTGKVWAALEQGGVDAYVEYTGTLTQETLVGEALKTTADLERNLAKRKLKMSRSLGFSNGYALGMMEGKAAELGISTISDLKKHPDLKVGFSTPFIKRADGWPGLKARYGLPFRTPDG